MDRATLTPRRWPIFCAAGAGVVGIALIYLGQWLQMPLYPDEIAFRLLTSRYLVDGATNFGIFPCLSNARTIPIVFRPIAYALSVADVELAWSMVRFAPLAGVLLALGATLTILLYRGAVAVALMTAAGFIGVAGSGLVLSRGEAPILFLSLACLVGYIIITRRHVPLVLSAAFLIASTSAALVAFFVHVQALILAPIVILTIVALIARTDRRGLWALGGLSILLVIAGAWASLSSKNGCTEYPSIALFFAKSEFPGLVRYEGFAGVQNYLWEKLPRYAGQFIFKTSYEINYLPGIKETFFGDWLPVLNAAIQSAVILNFILAVVATIITGATIAMTFSRKRPWGERLNVVTGMPAPYLFLGLTGHLALLIYDVPTAFYRSFHIHLMLILLNCLALSMLRGKSAALLWPVGIASMVISLCSAFISSSEMRSKFAGGWAGPSISLKTDWSMLRSQIAGVAQSCNIQAADSGIVIDDLTYDAMKRHPHLIPITYTGFAVRPKASEPAALYKLLRELSATAVVTRCEFLFPYGLTPQHRNNGICCLKLPAADAAAP